MYIKPPKFVRRIFPSLVWEMPPSEEVYLTFDDGPTPGVTEMILEQLAKYGAKATFSGKMPKCTPNCSSGSSRKGTGSATTLTATRKAGA